MIGVISFAAMANDTPCLVFAPDDEIDCRCDVWPSDHEIGLFNKEFDGESSAR
jgi:hypothetical protein